METVIRTEGEEKVWLFFPLLFCLRDTASSSAMDSELRDALCRVTEINVRYFMSAIG